MSSLGDRLREVPVPDGEGARERGSAVARAAFAEREPEAGRTGASFRPLLQAVAAAAIVIALLAFTPPGKAVTNWVRDTLGRSSSGRPTPAPALSRLPSGGSLLVQSPSGPWVVRADGSKRLLGPYREATWSPRGRFVGVTRAQGLLAVEPGGRVHWTLARPGASRPRWAPSGFAVAYLSGSMVRVVAGDGTGDRALARAVPGVAAEWQPGAPFVGAVAGQKVLRTGNTLAVSGPDGRVRAIDVSTGQALWTAAADSPARFLSWAGDGAHLLAGGALGVRVLDVVGRVAARIRMPAGAVATEAAFAPQGSRIALVRRRPGGVSELVLVDGGRQRLLFAGAGRLSGLKWSPDGRWLLVSWPPSDQFLFVRATGLPRVEAVARVGSEFNPRARGAAGAALPAGWCCSRP